jgi:hypothetical protein
MNLLQGNSCGLTAIQEHVVGSGRSIPFHIDDGRFSVDESFSDLLNNLTLIAGHISERSREDWWVFARDA